MASFIGSSKPGYAQKAQEGFSQGAQTASRQRRIAEEDKKSVGGGVMSTASMAASGAMVGSLFGPGPGTAIGAGIGAAVGLAGYLFS